MSSGATLDHRSDPYDSYVHVGPRCPGSPSPPMDRSCSPTATPWPEGWTRMVGEGLRLDNSPTVSRAARQQAGAAAAGGGAGGGGGDAAGAVLLSSGSTQNDNEYAAHYAHDAQHADAGSGGYQVMQIESLVNNRNVLPAMPSFSHCYRVNLSLRVPPP